MKYYIVSKDGHRICPIFSCLIIILISCGNDSGQNQNVIKNTPPDITFSTTLQVRSGPVYGLDYSADGRYLAAAGFNEFSLWNMDSLKVQGYFTHDNSYTWDVSWKPSATRQQIATAGEGGRVDIWNLESQQLLYSLNTGRAFCADWSNDGQHIASGSAEGLVRIHDAESGDLLTSYILDRSGGFPENAIICLQWSPEDAHIAAGCWYGGTILIDAETGQQMKIFESTTANRDDVNGLVWHPGGMELVTAHQDGYLRIWDVDNGSDFGAIKAHDGWIRGVAFSPDGNWLISGGQDMEVKVWNFQTRELALELSEANQQIWALEWSRDDRQIAAGSGIYMTPNPPGKIYVWDIGF